MQAAFARARGRLGRESALLGVSAGLMLGGLLLLGLAAPAALLLPDRAASLMVVLPGLAILAGIAAACLALARLLRRAGAAAAADLDPAGPDTAAAASGLPRPIGAQAPAVAWSHLVECGMVTDRPLTALSVLSGRVCGLVLVVLETGEGAHAVIRLPQPSPMVLLVAPGGAPWPHRLPPGPALTPVALPRAARGLAWASNRDTAAALLARLAPVLDAAAGGGALPFLAVREDHACLSWPGGTPGAAALIGADLARLLAA